jgi:hypothetical protein
MEHREELATLVTARLKERAELERLMLEPPGGENHGYRVNGSRQSLNWCDWIKEDFLSTPGWSCERPPSGRAPGRPRTIDPKLLIPKAIAAVERRLGFTVTEFQRVTGKGRLREEDRALRNEITERLMEVVGEGAAVSGLAAVLGRNERTIWRLAAEQRRKCRANSPKGEDVARRHRELCNLPGARRLQECRSITRPPDRRAHRAQRPT